MVLHLYDIAKMLLTDPTLAVKQGGEVVAFLAKDPRSAGRLQPAFDALGARNFLLALEQNPSLLAKVDTLGGKLITHLGSEEAAQLALRNALRTSELGDEVTTFEGLTKLHDALSTTPRVGEADASLVFADAAASVAHPTTSAPIPGMASWVERAEKTANGRNNDAWIGTAFEAQRFRELNAVSKLRAVNVEVAGFYVDGVPRVAQLDAVAIESLGVVTEYKAGRAGQKYYDQLERQCAYVDQKAAAQGLARVVEWRTGRGYTAGFHEKALQMSAKYTVEVRLLDGGGNVVEIFAPVAI